MDYDIIIIGAGPIGIVCGIEAKKAGLSFIILEKGVLVNALYHFPANMTFFSTSILLEIGEVPFISHNDKPTREEALEYYRRITEAWQLPVHLYETVTSVGKNKDHFTVTTSKGVYHSASVVIATGFYDQEVKLGIPGENLSKVKHYYDDPHPYFNQDLAIIGAGNSACDAALECWKKGARVTMIIRDGQIKDTIKYWIRPNIENRIKNDEIKAFFNAEVIEIKPHTILCKQDGILHELPNDFVLAMTGYQPDYLFLKECGITFEEDEYRTPSHHEHTLETNIKNLYLAGVIIGGLKTNKWFIENTRDHGKKIIDHILSNKS